MELIAVGLIMCAIVAVLKVFLDYKSRLQDSKVKYDLGVAQIAASQEGSEYTKGVHDGMERAAGLLASGSKAMVSDVYTPSPAELARMIRAANK